MKKFGQLVLLELLETIIAMITYYFAMRILTSRPNSTEPLFVLVFVFAVLTLAFGLLTRIFGYFSRILFYLSFCYFISSTTLLIWIASYGDDTYNASYKEEIKVGVKITTFLPLLWFIIDMIHLLRKRKTF